MSKLCWGKAEPPTRGQGDRARLTVLQRRAPQGSWGWDGGRGGGWRAGATSGLAGKELALRLVSGHRVGWFKYFQGLWVGGRAVPGHLGPAQGNRIRQQEGRGLCTGWFASEKRVLGCGFSSRGTGLPWRAVCLTRL